MSGTGLTLKDAPRFFELLNQMSTNEQILILWLFAQSDNNKHIEIFQSREFVSWASKIHKEIDIIKFPVEQLADSYGFYVYSLDPKNQTIQAPERYRGTCNGG